MTNHEIIYLPVRRSKQGTEHRDVSADTNVYCVSIQAVIGRQQVTQQYTETEEADAVVSLVVKPTRPVYIDAVTKHNVDSGSTVVCGMSGQASAGPPDSSQKI